MTTRRASTSTSGTRAATNGTSASRPSGVRTASRSWAAVLQAGHLTDLRPVQVVHREPDQLVVVELLGVVRGARGRRGVQQDAAGRLRRRPVLDLVERQQQDPWCHRVAVTVDGPQRAGRAARRLGAQHGTDGEPSLRLVGAQVDGQLAAQAVRLAEPTDDDLDLVHGCPPSGAAECWWDAASPRGATPCRLLLGRAALSGDGRRRRSRSVPPLATREGADDGAERGRRATAATDHLAEVVGVDPDPSRRSRDAASCRAPTTSSGCSTTPRTRCSSASASMVRSRSRRGPRRRVTGSSRPARWPRPGGPAATLGGLDSGVYAGTSAGVRPWPRP